MILHGLSTLGFAARAVVSAVGGNDPSSLKYFGVRFTSPVKPGDALETSIWEQGPGPDGTTEVGFVTKNLKTGKVRRFQLDTGRRGVRDPLTSSCEDLYRQWCCIREESREEQTMKSPPTSSISLAYPVSRVDIWKFFASTVQLHPFFHRLRSMTVLSRS